MKGPGQPIALDEGFYHNFFYRNITFLTFLTFLKKVRNVRNAMLRVAVVVKNDYIGQSHSVRKMKGPGQLCAGDEGARGSSVRERKGPGQPCERDEGFLPQLFYHNITFLTFLRKVRNVRNVMP